MNIITAIVQGILQGLSIFLPISSNGVLSLYQYFGGVVDTNVIFLVAVIRLGVIAAILAAFYEDVAKICVQLGQVIKEIFTGKFTTKTNNPDRKMVFMLILASLPLFVLLLIRKWAAHFITDGDIIVEGVLFLISALILVFAAAAPHGRAGVQKMKPRSALTIGVSQLFGIFPGISRTSTTMSVGLAMGFAPSFALKFSFLMAIPALLGSSILQIADSVKQEAEMNFLVLFVGMLVAAIVGYLAIFAMKWLMKTGKYKLLALVLVVLSIVIIIIGVVGVFSNKDKTEKIDTTTTSIVTQVSSDENTETPASTSEEEPASETPQAA